MSNRNSNNNQTVRHALIMQATRNFHFSYVSNPPFCLRVTGLLNIGLGRIRIGHLLVLFLLLVATGSLASLLLGSTLGRPLSLEPSEDGLPLGLDLLEVALHDGASKGLELVNLGNVDSLLGIVTLIVEPVL